MNAYRSTSGEEVASTQTDLLIRLISMGRAQRTLAATGGMCAAAAAGIAGSVVGRAVSPAAIERGVVRLGHPAGVMEVGAKVVEGPAGSWTVGLWTAQSTCQAIT
jgi:2-methylaconitate cis-trans-isomerase PrpF